MRTILIKLKALLLLTCLVLSPSCSTIPTPPVVEQCGYSYKFKKFRCCKTDSGACRNVALTDASMEGAQVLSPDDFKAEERWITDLLNALTQKRSNMIEVTQ